MVFAETKMNLKSIMLVVYEVSKLSIFNSDPSSKNAVAFYYGFNLYFFKD